MLRQKDFECIDQGGPLCDNCLAGDVNGEFAAGETDYVTYRKQETFAGLPWNNYVYFCEKCFKQLGKKY